MIMAKKLREMRGLSDDELGKEYDKVADNTAVGLNYFWGEILRREHRRETKWLTILTISVLVVTVVSAIGVFAR